ncbi:hypothetical protein [Pseudomonas zhanjiangensis]|uniref:Uncharacterized protein n=1 Tax=Pseudomonas zhanjiangensis TaxID=3239015 RepID=A0ABV3YX65_9PSED
MSIRKAAIYVLAFIAIGPPIGSLLFSIPITLFMDSESSIPSISSPSFLNIFLVMGLLSYYFGWLPAAASGITYGALLGKASKIKLYSSTAAAGLLAATLFCVVMEPQPNLNYAFLLAPTIFASVLTTGIINLFRQ